MDKFFYPIPKERLIARFKPVFEQLSKTRNATLLALPFAGRSSHLRFIASQDIFDLKDCLVWTETEICTELSRFLSEICIKLDQESENHPSIISRDSYLIQILLKSIIRSQNSVILIISLGRLNYSIAPDVEQLFTLLQKECPNLKILWSIDTVAFRNYSPKHTSCNMLENIFYFPTFDQEETKHSLKRIALTRHRNISKSLENEGIIQTGGLAGLFHLYLFSGTQTEEILKTIQQELTLSPELSLHLTTPEFRQFLAGKPDDSYVYKGLKLKNPPTAQEIGMLNIFLEKENQHISRDEIAQILWGKLWQEKYSDWALDKSVSRLRNNLISKTHRLITIKSMGYSLICV